MPFLSISYIWALILVGTSTSLTIQPRQSSNNTIFQCLQTRNVSYADNTSPNWNQLTTPYNLALPYIPAVVILPNASQEVADSVRCAADAGLRVQAKSGGHSYASFSSGGQDGSAIIDMENFNTIELDQASWIAKVGAGVRLGNLALAIYDQGNRALPHGTCPGVGIGGHATHGGYGYASRKWGLTLDTIVALDVVLANGSQIHTTESSFPDIFFAMRGAGESFGIVTSFYLQTLPAPSFVLTFSASLAVALQDANVSTSVFYNLQSWVLTSQYLTPNLTFGIYTDNGGTFSITGFCLECDDDNFNTNIFPAMLSGFPATDQSVQKMSWIDALASLSNGKSLQQPLTGYNEHDTFYAKSVVSKNSEPLSVDTIKSFWTYIINSQGKGPFFSIINLYGGPGSKINVPAPDSSAYSDRDALWVFQNYGYTSTGVSQLPNTTIELIDGLNNAITSIQPDGDFGAYLNYVDPDLSAYEAAELYYGPETYDKLVQIKTEVDPEFVFWNPQAIGNAPVLRSK